MSKKFIPTTLCLGDLAERWARKNKVPYPKGRDCRTLHNPEYLAMYNQWPGFDDLNLSVLVKTTQSKRK